MLIDLQLHSTYSDGYLTPSELAQKLFKQKIKVASLTDHNTVSGLMEFRHECKKYGIKTIPGLELYVKLNNKRFNLLWFNFNYKNPELHKMLRNSQARRRAKVRAMFQKLNKLGFKISTDAILDKYNHYAPINHIIDDILKNKTNRDKIKNDLGHSAREEEIIRKYFFNKNIGRMNESYINIKHVVALREKIGGQLILNHPGKYNHLQKQFLHKLKELKIDGLEVMSPHHSIGATLYAQFIAMQLGFIMTGGSDFHRYEGNKAPIQSSWEFFKIDSKLLPGVNKILKNQK